MLILLILSVLLKGAFQGDRADQGITCRFKHQQLVLRSGMRRESKAFLPRTGLSNFDLDTLSNWFSPERRYVEIIRQDDPLNPQFGIALGFEFDEENGDYPYTPAFAKIQLKDFRWGGVEFSPRDTFNYTGVSNEISEDLSVQVLGFERDTIYGRFSGLLLSGAGPMAPVDSGTFRVLVYRVE